MRNALGTILGAGVLVLLGTSSASACENAVELTVFDAARIASSAEQALNEGRPQLALRRAVRVRSILRTHGAETTPARARGINAAIERVVAVAIVRLEGRVDARWRHRPNADPSARRQSLTLALQMLEAQRRARADDPMLTARYAEALAALDRQAEARRLLIQLDDADLMPDADAYRVLAVLSEHAGDRARRNAAVDACQLRAGERARMVCPHVVSIRVRS
jgi:predicted Zn-dependent protease